MVPQISPGVAAAWLRDGEAVLLDVREAPELELAAVEGATHVAMSTITSRLSDLDRAQKYAVMCHHGMRSMQAAGQLLAQGYRNVYNLEGGIDAWSIHIDNAIPRY